MWADRLPRHLVLVAAATVQGAVQAVAGGLIVSGHATVWSLAVLALVYGLADGFVIPTSQGLIPAIVSSTRLQQANALLGLSRSLVGVLGPALGGVLVALGSPGGALLVDAASFGLAALLLLRVSIPRTRRHGRAAAVLRRAAAGLERVSSPDLDLDDDRLLRDRQLRVDNALRARPARREAALLGGASTWALWVSSFGAGTIVGASGRPALPSVAPAARVVCRRRSARVPAVRGLRSSLPVVVLVGVGSARRHRAGDPPGALVHVFQRNVPEAALSRVSSYDALGSFVLMPLGSIVAGPVASVIGITQTLLGDDGDRARLLRDHHRAAERLGDPRRRRREPVLGMIRDRSLLALLSGEFVSRLGSQFTRSRCRGSCS